jgi:hypothetical protein
MKSDDFQLWAELAKGDEERQILPIVDVAAELESTPMEIVRVALTLKRETNNQHGRPCQWVRGVPWFSIAEVARIGQRLQIARAAANLADAATAQASQRN